MKDEFVWDGRIFRRLPGTALFTAVNEVIAPCPKGFGHMHPALVITAVEEHMIERMIFNGPESGMGRA